VNSKSYIPQTKSKKNRFVSEEIEFKKSLKVLKTDSEELKFDTKLERQKYFSSVLDNCDLDTVVDRVFKISTLKDITPNEKTKLKKLRSLLESEASVVLNTTSAKGKAFIAEYISK
jgi:RNA polymerase-interacting CarD/CdnL/TRCF family regulator